MVAIYGRKVLNSIGTRQHIRRAEYKVTIDSKPEVADVYRRCGNISKWSNSIRIWRGLGVNLSKYVAILVFS